MAQLARARYAETNHTLLTELLMEREDINLSRSIKLEPLGENGTGKHVAVDGDLLCEPVKGRTSDSRVVVPVEVHRAASMIEC